jgi:hypothetical protein
MKEFRLKRNNMTLRMLLCMSIAGVLVVCNSKNVIDEAQQDIHETSEIDGSSGTDKPVEADPYNRAYEHLDSVRVKTINLCATCPVEAIKGEILFDIEGEWKLMAEYLTADSFIDYSCSRMIYAFDKNGTLEIISDADSIPGGTYPYRYFDSPPCNLEGVPAPRLLIGEQELDCDPYYSEMSVYRLNETGQAMYPRKDFLRIKKASQKNDENGFLK